MLQTKNGNNWTCSLQEEIKNLKMLTHDDWRKQFENNENTILTSRNTIHRKTVI